MKHPGPWTIPGLYAMQDANGAPVADVLTLDPETRAILTRAAEMWEAIKASVTTHLDPLIVRDEFIDRAELVDKINAEIAAATGGKEST